ncbi:prolipoprotein diacylglyceryl transferase [Ruminococcus sp.]|uniref:prolipoprotein diacylglyceryl transferase n=1 Tax=Ruminococcus sp. TaxID=41978 RepID=UPI0038908594
MFPVFEIFGKQIGMYGVMAVLGFAACFLVGSGLIRRFDISIYDFALTMIAACVGMVIGASCLYAATNYRLLIDGFSHFSEIGWSGLWTCIRVAFGGFVYYGGFIGAAVGILIYTKYAKDVKAHRDHLLDIYAVLVPLFHGFGRIGCFFGGCCYGVESELGFTVHNNPLNPSINGVNRFPIQLVESACNFILFLILLYLFRKGVMHSRLIYLYLLTYPVVRFITELFRGDTYRGILFGLSTSQWISIVLFVFALIMLPLKTRKLKAAEAPRDQVS